MLTPISRITVTQSILNELLNSIKSGTWKSGDKLPSEGELAISFHAGRNSVREAVKALNNMGVLESKAGHGTFLSENALKNILTADLITNGYTDASLEEISEVRNLIESQSSYWAALRSTSDDIIQVKDLLNKSALNHNSSLSMLNKIHFDFHLLVVRLADNSFLLKLYKSLCAEAEIQRKEFDLLPENDQRNLILDQEDIMNYIVSHEPDEARLSMEHHVEKGMKLLKQYLHFLDDK